MDHGITPSVLEEINQETDDSLLQDSILMNLESSNIESILGFKFYESGEHTFPTHLHENTHAEQDWISLRPYLVGNLKWSSKILTK